ncbi:MAG: hypothetical protein M3P95_12400 [Actinomycetota bacterium]|nr:hypothetical protein [Actinomycetota bacterium]
MGRQLEVAERGDRDAGAAVEVELQGQLGVEGPDLALDPARRGDRERGPEQRGDGHRDDAQQGAASGLAQVSYETRRDRE